MVTASGSDSSQVELLGLGGKVFPHLVHGCLQISGETLTTGLGARDDVFCVQGFALSWWKHFASAPPLMDVCAVPPVECNGKGSVTVTRKNRILALRRGLPR